MYSEYTYWIYWHLRCSCTFVIPMQYQTSQKIATFGKIFTSMTFMWCHLWISSLYGTSLWSFGVSRLLGLCLMASRSLRIWHAASTTITTSVGFGDHGIAASISGSLDTSTYLWEAQNTRPSTYGLCSSLLPCGTISRAICYSGLALYVWPCFQKWPQYTSSIGPNTTNTGGSSIWQPLQLASKLRWWV